MIFLKYNHLFKRLADQRINNQKNTIIHDIRNKPGKKCIVTGGTSGLGRAITKAFTDAGIFTIIVARKKEDLMTAREEFGDKCGYELFDLENTSEIPDFVEQLEKQYGQLDILVNNAGVHLKKNALDVSDEEFQKVIQINQNVVFALSREVARKMEPQGSGVILNISSMAAKYGIPQVIAYTASKSAVEGMTRALAVEWSPKGIRVNAIAPGFIYSKMSASALDNDPERKERVFARTPMKRMGQPEEVGAAALFMVSDAASYITGTVLPVDGGNSIGF
ncbi:MAG: SDR family NAD(P)-dependent oxidoreductase [Marinilabiliaceae bacterium]